MAGESGPCSAWLSRSAATCSGSARRVGEDHDLGRTGGQVDADLAEDLELGGGHPGVARPDDPVDRRDAGVGQPVGERPDRLGAAGDDELVDPDEAGGAGEDRVDAARPGGPGWRRRRRRRRRRGPARRTSASELGYAAVPPGT